MWYQILETQSIFSYFKSKDFDFEKLSEFRTGAKSGDCVLNQGDAMDHLIIPLTVNFQLCVQGNKSENQVIGNITGGRSINLYCFLRELPTSYSALALDDGEYLKIPRNFLEALFTSHENVRRYLLRVTEDSDFQALSKELSGVGLAKDLIMEFIVNLTSHEILPQTLLNSRGQEAKQIFYLLEGNFLVYDRNNNKKSWQIPLKSWHFWKETIDHSPASYSITSGQKSRFLSIKAEAIESIKSQFPEDFEILNEWFTNGSFQTERIEDDNADVDQSISELFKDSVEVNTWRFSFPVVKQNDEMDCGPACLAMISEYFNKKLSIQFWRSRLSTDRTGTSFYDLGITTEKTGFISHCLYVEDLNEVDDFLFPFIALRKYHYVVVYKIKKDKVIIGDPARGICEVDIEDFHDGMENVGLFLKPNADFYLNEDSPSPWLHYLSLFKGLEKEIGLAFICSLMGVIFSLLPPLLSQLALDDILIQKDKPMLWVFMGCCLAIAITTHAVSWAKSYYFVYIINKFNFRSSSIFIQKMFSLPYTFFSTRHVGDFTSRLAEMAQMRHFITGTLFNVSLNILTLFIYSGVLLAINLKMALFVIMLAPVMLLIPLFFTRALTHSTNEIYTKASEQSSLVTDIIEGISILKSSGAEFSTRLRFEEKLIDLIKSQNKFSMTAVNVDTLTRGYNQASQYMIMGFAVYMGISGELTAGQVISFTLISAQIFGPLQEITKEWGQAVQMKSVLSRLNDVFLTPSEKLHESNSNPNLHVKRLAGDIEFKNVWFRYGGEGADWVLKNVNFKIEAGQKLAIVGPSGSGKSTLAYLLNRMYEPTKGQILIDGKDSRDYDLNWLRSQIGLLHQDNRLFSGSLAENVALDSLDPDVDRLIDSSHKAAAETFVEKKSGHFGHQIPHGGLGFSGGEKQKVALMRLFYKSPAIVVLDEATSALDGISEREIIQNVRQSLGKNTIINIAHRYSTVKYSDFAMVMLDGRIVGFGSLEHLKETNRVFQNLFGFDESDGVAADSDSDVEEAS